MISIDLLISLHKKYNGPIPDIQRLQALFGSVSMRYECARAGSMVQHYSAVSSQLINKISALDRGAQGALANMQRHCHKQELACLLSQRREWKKYRSLLGNCPKI